MIAPVCKLTIGDMYKDTSGYISGLTYTMMDEGTWETTFLKLPKYVQVSCTFVYIGDRLPSSTQKHFELPFVAEETYDASAFGRFFGSGRFPSQKKFGSSVGEAKKLLKNVNF
jgi:hypothetical protein